MNVTLDRKTVLFYRALEDIDVASDVCYRNPNISVYHSCQAVEKLLKGYLRCRDDDGEDNTQHNLLALLSDVQRSYSPTLETVQNIGVLNEWTQGLRYKYAKSDPTIGDATLAMNQAVRTIDEFSDLKHCSLEIQFARDEYKKYKEWAKSEHLASVEKIMKKPKTS